MKQSDIALATGFLLMILGFIANDQNSLHYSAAAMFTSMVCRAIEGLK